MFCNTDGVRAGIHDTHLGGHNTHFVTSDWRDCRLQKCIMTSRTTLAAASRAQKGS